MTHGPSLTRASLQREGPQGLREPATAAEGLPGWRPQEAPVLHTTGPVRSLAGARCCGQSVSGHLRGPCPLGKHARLILPESVPADSRSLSPPSYYFLARAGFMPRMDSSAPLWARYRVGGAPSGESSNAYSELPLIARRVPSIFVQLFWNAIVGPWILWKIRHVNDVHYWAWQTRLAIIAGCVQAPSLYLRGANCGHADYPARPFGWLLPTPNCRAWPPLIGSCPQQAGKFLHFFAAASIRSGIFLPFASLVIFKKLERRQVA